MADGEPQDLLGTAHFRVLIGRQELGFSEVSRLSSATELEADEPQHRFETVVLRRALGSDLQLYEWRRNVVEGKEDRRTVTLHQLDGAGGRVANSWRLLRAWPCRWSSPAFSALRNEIAYEELELAFDDLVWLRPRSAPRAKEPD